MRSKIKVGLFVLALVFALAQSIGFLYYYYEFQIPSFNDSQTNLKWVEENGIASIVYNDELLSLAEITAGEFTKGSVVSIDELKSSLGNASFLEDEFPPKKRSIPDAFWLAKSETSYRLFDLFVEATGYQTMAEHEGFGWLWNGNGFDRVNNVNWRNYTDSISQHQPVVMISWLDARAFTNWLSGVLGRKVRLPTDDEWEYSCKAGSAGIYHFGNDTTRLADYAWYKSNTVSQNRSFAHLIGQKKANAWGLFDMHGNVWEWCNDSPKWWMVRNKSIRGGGWLNGCQSLRSSFNATEHINITEPHIGFRILVEKE